MPQVKDLKPGEHFINKDGALFLVLCQGGEVTFTRHISTGEESLYDPGAAVSLAHESQVRQEGKVAVIRSIFEDASTTRQAAEQIIDYLQAEQQAIPGVMQEISAKYVERCTESVKAEDDQLLNGINALAGAAFALAGSDSPGYQDKAARIWPWNHPQHLNETHREKFRRVFVKDGEGYTTFRDRLVWAAVLIIAEIEKQDRAELKNGK